MIDTHCHLQAKYYGESVREVVDRAAAAGVRSCVAIGSAGSLEVCDEAIRLAEADDRVWATVGFHPHEAKRADAAAIEAVATRARHPRVLAVGEIGLDYHYDYSPRDVQREVFRAFLDVARQVDKPVVIHNRESDADCIEILASEKAEEIGGVVHCFTSSWELAKAALDRGFYLGFTGIVSFRNAEEVRDVLRRTPLDRIVVETDSPFLSPVPYRGKQNEPAWVTHVAAAVAETLGMSVEEVESITDENARRLYGAQL